MTDFRSSNVPTAAAAALECLPAAIVLVDAVGVPQFANERARHLAANIDADIPAALQTLMRELPQTGDPAATLPHKDLLTCGTVGGSETLLARQWGACCIDGLRAVAFHPVLKDADAGTKPKPAEQQPPWLEMMQSDKLATVGQLAAGMAHEINNPICYIQSNLGTFQDYVNKLLGLLELSDDLLRSHQMTSDERLDAMAARKDAVDFAAIAEDLPVLLAESREGVDRIREITQNLRNFSRTDATPTYQLVDLQRVLTTTIDLVRSLSDKRTVFATQFDTLPLVHGNSTQLSQVFMNILVNATQAIEPDGRIHVHAAQDTGGNVEISISDNGCGMDENVLQHLFEPFFTTKRVGVGTGLGLSISYEIIHEHGGRIDVHSAIGKGSAFHIVLPTKSAALEPLSAI